MPRHLLPLTLLLASALVLAGCGGDDPVDDAVAEGAGNGDESEITVDGEDGEDVTVRGDGDDSVEVETDDGTMGLTAGGLPDEWPEEFVVLEDDVEVGNAFTFDDDDGFGIEAMFGYTDDFDATIAYVEGLADEGWDVDVVDDSDDFVERAEVTLTGFGWDGEIEVIEAPNTVMNITLVRENG